MAYCRQIISPSIYSGKRAFSKKRDEGFILLPCILLLSLVSITAFGLLNLSRSEIRTSAELDKNHHSWLAAQSGKAIGLYNLKKDSAYTGGADITIPGGGDGTVDVVVTNTANFDYQVTSTGKYEGIERTIDIKAQIYPRQYSFVTSILGNLDINSADVKFLGDVYVGGAIDCNPASLITGDLHLFNARSLTLVDDQVTEVDGKDIPVVNGDVLDDQPELNQIGLLTDALVAIAVSDSQYFAKGVKVPSDTNFKGVVCLGPGWNEKLNNILIEGVLIVLPENATPQSTLINPTSKIKVSDKKFLKIIADPTVCEDIAIIAPETLLEGRNGSWIDLKGTVIIGEGKFHDGAITGAAIIQGELQCKRAFIFQAPEYIRNANPNCLVFDEFSMTVSEQGEQ